MSLDQEMPLMAADRASPAGPRVLACVGDANAIQTWSGIPHYFLQAARRQGFLQQGWATHPERLKLEKALWNLSELATTGRYGGYQYSRGFHERLFRQLKDQASPAEVISHFPLFPPPAPLTCPVNYYIDATFSQYFESYDHASKITPRVMASAIEREREAYGRARRIICMSRWAARSVVDDYEVPPHKVHVIPGGANIPDTALSALDEIDAPIVPGPLRLGFVGKDFRRKNLEFLLDVAERVSARGFPVEVVAAGFDPAHASRHPLLRTVGFIDKAARLHEFVDYVSSCHFGCLFSQAEAFGISNLEFIRLGVPVLTWDVGGMADTVPAGLGEVFPAHASAEQVADAVLAHVREPRRYAALRGEVRRRAAEATWDRAVRQFKAVWAGSQDYSYAHLVGESVGGQGLGCHRTDLAPET